MLANTMITEVDLMAALSATCRSLDIDIETIFELTGPRTTVPSGSNTHASVPSIVFTAAAQFTASSTAPLTSDKFAYVPTTLFTTPSIPLAASLAPTSSLVVIRVDESKELRSRATGGIVAAVTLAGFCILGTLAWLCLRKSRSQKSNQAAQDGELRDMESNKHQTRKIPLLVSPLGSWQPASELGLTHLALEPDPYETGAERRSATITAKTQSRTLPQVDEDEAERPPSQLQLSQSIQG